MPTFSGSVDDFIVNYLLEVDILKRIQNKIGKVRLGGSPIRGQEQPSNLQLPFSHDKYRYLQSLIEVAYVRFYKQLGSKD